LNQTNQAIGLLAIVSAYQGTSILSLKKTP